MQRNRPRQQERKPLRRSHFGQVGTLVHKSTECRASPNVRDAERGRPGERTAKRAVSLAPATRVGTCGGGRSSVRALFRIQAEPDHAAAQRAAVDVQHLGGAVLARELAVCPAERMKNIGLFHVPERNHGGVCGEERRGGRFRRRSTARKRRFARRVFFRGKVQLSRALGQNERPVPPDWKARGCCPATLGPQARADRPPRVPA